jgi:uncharacterized protein GlcG (DUF336 family)
MSMADTIPHRKLTHECAMKMLNAGIRKANDMGVPQCIHIVDDGGHLLAFIRMDGGKFLSTDSSLKKALTAASNRVPTGDVPPDVDVKLAIATEGKLVNLFGGLPIIVDECLVGAIGVGSGTGEQDLEVARAALAVVEGAKQW